MKAGVFHEQGGPEVVRYEDAPDPTPMRGEVVVRVWAAALNRLDLKAREGRPETFPMPHIGGLDAAGEIAELGAGVSDWKVGDRVVVVPVLSCGVCALCRGGDAALCDEQRVFGFQTQGGFAEYAVVPAANLVRAPERVPFHELAALPTVYLTAWRMLVGQARLQRGETALIHSVGSGVGSAALQIAKHLGAAAIVTASSAAKLDEARRLGADAAINYRSEDTMAAVNEFTEGKGVHVVVETVGADTWETSLKCVRKNGRIVTCGVTSGAVVEMSVRHLYQRQIRILGSVMGGRAELETIVGLAQMGHLRPVIDRRFPLSELAEAHRALESRTQFGKIVIDLSYVG